MPRLAYTSNPAALPTIDRPARKKLSAGRLLGIYVVLSACLGMVLLAQSAASLGGATAADALTALGIGAGFLSLPMIFATGAWWLWGRMVRGSATRRWTSLAVYSGATLLLWIVVGFAGSSLDAGSSEHSLISLSMMIGYSFYALLPVAAVTGVLAIAAALVATLRSVHWQH